MHTEKYFPTIKVSEKTSTIIRNMNNCLVVVFSPGATNYLKPRQIRYSQEQRKVKQGAPSCKIVLQHLIHTCVPDTQTVTKFVVHQFFQSEELTDLYQEE